VVGQKKQSPVNPLLPTVTSYALDKSKVTLPADLAAPLNVLVLYFQPDQVGAAIAWVQGLQSLRAAHPGFQTYVIPVYARENLLYRWWIDASLRSEAPANEDRHTTVPIFVDKPRYLKTLGIENEKQPVILLADKAGSIKWKTQGVYEPWRRDRLGAEF